MNHYKNEPETNDTLQKEKFSFTISIFEWADALVPIIVVFVFIMIFLFRVNDRVDGQSMMDTLHDGDRLLVTQMFTPKQGDIVIIKRGRYLNRRLIKRIIATEGQTLDINFEKGNIIVDGIILDEPYIKEPTKRFDDGEIPKIIPNGYVFVMGDNRNNSADSRSRIVGLIDKRDIVGKAEWIIFNLNSGILKMFERFGSVY